MSGRERKECIVNMITMLNEVRTAIDRMNEISSRIVSRRDKLVMMREEILSDFVNNHSESDTFDTETGREYMRITNEIGSADAGLEIAGDILSKCRSVVHEINRQMKSYMDDIENLA